MKSIDPDFINKQFNLWLKRATEAGIIKKLKFPERYQVVNNK